MIGLISQDIFKHLKADDAQRTVDGNTYYIDPSDHRPLWEIMGMKSAVGIEKRIVPGIQPDLVEDNLPIIEHLVTPVGENSVSGTLSFRVVFRIMSNDYSFIELNAVSRRVRALMLVDKKMLWNAVPPSGRYNQPFYAYADTGNQTTDMAGIYSRMITIAGETGPQVDLIDRPK